MTDPVAHWEARYAERDQIWSGKPNAALVATVVDVPPGRALDIGCGEGADSVWLAQRGWHVPDDRIRWVTADLSSWQPDGTYDLVSACFLHSTLEFPRRVILQRAAAAVAPGGCLLIVGHAAAPPWSKLHDHANHRFLSPAEEVDELRLDMSQWRVLISETQQRAATGPDGESADLEDSVVLLQRDGAQ